MSEALSWLGQIFEAILSTIPRLQIVRSTHQGVKFKRGKVVKQIHAGICVYWPLVTEIQIYPVERQTVNLQSQTLVTKDERVLGIGGVVVYKIRNIVAFLTNTYDGEDTIRDIALTTVSRVCRRSSFAALQQQSDAFSTHLTSSLQEDLYGFGVQVIKVELSDFFPCDIVIATWSPGDIGVSE